MVGDVEQIEPVFDAGEGPIADRLEDVGSDLASLIERGAVDRGERLEPLARQGRRGGATRLGRIGKAIVVPLVADEGAHQRLLRQDPFPRFGGEVVELLFRLHEARPSFPVRGVQG